MVDKRIIELIKSEEAKGYSEEQLKQTLLKKGFKSSDVNEAVSLSTKSQNQTLNQLLSQKGKLFMILFYILLVIFSLVLVLGFIYSLIAFNLIILIASIIFGAMTIRYLIKRNLYKLLVMVSFTVVLFPLVIFPSIYSFINIGNVTFYVLISVYALIAGMLTSYMLNKVSETFKKYLIIGIFSSLVLASIYAASGFTQTILSTLSAQLAQASINNSTETTSLIGLFGSNFFNGNIAFSLVFLFFNIPYFYFSFQREDKNLKLFLLYLIPIIIFILVSYVLSIQANNILTST